MDSVGYAPRTVQRSAMLAVALLLAVTDASARDARQVRLFRHTHPCPATQSIKGACPGYVVDHIVPLCAGGADDTGNMQWQEYRVSLAKDKDERALCRWLHNPARKTK